MFLLSPKEKIKRSQAVERDGNWRASRLIWGPVPNNIDITQNDGTTGQVLGAGEKRIVQLA